MPPRRLLKSLLFAVCIAVAVSPATVRAAGESGKQAKEGELSASKFVTMYPFILPIIAGDSKDKQYTVVLALELEDENGRDELTRLSAKIRDALYPELFRLISFRDREPRYISSSALKRKLTPIVQKIAGAELVRGIVVKESYESDLP